MSISKLKLIVFTTWFICGSALFLFNIFLPVKAQIRENNQQIVLKSKPDRDIIERFDDQIQQRFLTEPYFGIRRIAPVTPTNPHFESFYPKNENEKASVASFEKEGFNTSLYLFGKRTKPKVIKGKQTEQFNINYRLFDPLPVTFGLKEKNLQPSDKLLKQVKKAFLAFQTPNSPNENEYNFDIGKWSYVAKPVRAVNQTCIQCHQDYVVTAKLGDGKFKFRKRRIGDANGVLVYGFSRKEP